MMTRYPVELISILQSPIKAERFYSEKLVLRIFQFYKVRVKHISEFSPRF